MGDLADDLFKFIAHGEEKHRQWLQHKLKAFFAARDDHPLLDPNLNPTSEQDPKVVAALQALPNKSICQRLRGIYDLSPDFLPRLFYTGAISHEAARRIEALSENPPPRRLICPECAKAHNP